MAKRAPINHDHDTSSPRREDREQAIRGWSRDGGDIMARDEGLELTDEHWDVIDYLRERFVAEGDPESAREIAEDLGDRYADRGGDRYLRKLFPGGPVSQGTRIAGLPEPAYAVDPSFGTSY